LLALQVDLFHSQDLVLALLQILNGFGDQSLP